VQAAASSAGTYAFSSLESGTSRAISMIGLAGRLSTEVEPTCSILTTRLLRIDRMRATSRGSKT